MKGSETTKFSAEDLSFLLIQIEGHMISKFSYLKPLSIDFPAFFTFKSKILNNLTVTVSYSTISYCAPYTKPL